MTEKPELNDNALEMLFASARAEAPLPSDALVARVLADAERAAPVPAAPPVPVWRALFGAIGGWRGGAGLALAGVAGLAIGFVSPEALDAVAPGYALTDAGYGLEDLMPGFSSLLDEG
jgi:hypothetical protein